VDCSFKGVAGGEGTAVEVGGEEGELQCSGSFGNDEGLGKATLGGGVFDQGGVSVEDLAIATGGPIAGGVEATVVDAEECSGGEGIVVFWRL
jgi:hypothetical protein